jgi:hypothetical protein
MVLMAPDQLVNVYAVARDPAKGFGSLATISATVPLNSRLPREPGQTLGPALSSIREPEDLVSPDRQPGETGSGDRLEYCLLVRVAVGFVAGVPGAPNLVAEPLGHLVPVAAAHEPSWVGLITAVRYRATANTQR